MIKPRWHGMRLVDLLREHFAIELEADVAFQTPEGNLTTYGPEVTRCPLAVRYGSWQAGPFEGTTILQTLKGLPPLEENQEVEYTVHWQEPWISPPPDPPTLIVSQTPEVLLVYKPAGIPVLPCRRFNKMSLREMILSHLSSGYLHPLSRLDIDTSGLLYFALTSVAARDFIKTIKEKLYIARVAKPLSFDDGLSHRVDLPIALDRSAVPLRGYVDKEKGRSCVSRFYPLPSLPDFVLAVPETGRTHQLRIHLAASGSPIVGDLIYGSPSSSGLCLHCAYYNCTKDRQVAADIACAVLRHGWLVTSTAVLSAVRNALLNPPFA